MSHAERSGLVSIITPAFDAAHCIGETYASLQAQTYTAWEWLVVDDGSTDDTPDLVRALAEKDPRIRLLAVAGETGLPARARNVGLAAARGDFLAFLDADDLWHPEKLARQMEHLANHPEAGGVCTWFRTFGDEGRVRREDFRLRTAPTCSLEEVLGGMPIVTSSLLIRRACYDRVGGMDEDPRLYSTEDVEYAARLLQVCRIDRIREVLVDYRLASATKPSISLDTALTARHRLWNVADVFEEKGVFPPAQLRRYRAYLHYAEARAALHGGGSSFRRHLLRAVASGQCPWQAWVMLGLSVLPAGALSPLIIRLLRLQNRRKMRNAAPVAQ